MYIPLHRGWFCTVPNGYVGGSEYQLAYVHSVQNDNGQWAPSGPPSLMNLLVSTSPL